MKQDQGVVITVGSKNGVDRKMDKSKSRTDLLAAGKKKVYLYFIFFFVKCVCVFFEEIRCTYCIVVK